MLSKPAFYMWPRTSIIYGGLRLPSCNGRCHEAMTKVVNDAWRSLALGLGLSAALVTIVRTEISLRRR